MPDQLKKRLHFFLKESDHVLYKKISLIFNIFNAFPMILAFWLTLLLDLNEIFFMSERIGQRKK